MSKAFRSDDGAAEEVARPLPVGRRPVTPTGHAEHQLTLQALLRAISGPQRAAAEGDVEARRTLDGLLRQILVTERILALSDVAPEPAERPERVVFGAEVRAMDEDHERGLRYVLVGPDEIDVSSGKISHLSPVGRALMGRTVGERTFLKRPAGILEVVVTWIGRPKRV